MLKVAKNEIETEELIQKTSLQMHWIYNALQMVRLSLSGTVLLERG